MKLNIYNNINLKDKQILEGANMVLGPKVLTKLRVDFCYDWRVGCYAHPSRPTIVLKWWGSGEF